MILDHDHRITAEHRSRAAVVYVRQSCPEQVRRNAESARVQLGLREKAITLGWSHPTVIDDDLGVSASGFSERAGFKELLAQVALHQVGIILSLDASRLSRNSKDWAQLFELCAHFNTLIADLDQVYDLSHPNDRMVMGIKGTVSEMELLILRRRLSSGTEAKAARGELRLNLPTGYAYNAVGKVVFDPDKRVHEALRTMFDKFASFTSVRQLAMWYRDTETLFPVARINWSRQKRWSVPSSRTLYNLLRHPIYTGAYVWGRRYTEIKCVDGKLVKRVGQNWEVEKHRVFIRDHHAAYIGWEQFLENCAKLCQNRPRWKMQENNGAIRDGLALLAGILRCGHCGGRIHVGYKKASALYHCDGGHENGSRRCCSFGSKRIDERVGNELCRAFEPFAMKAAVAAAEMEEERHAQGIESARMQVEAVEYESSRAFEQFDECDPKNRLVADTLEERLNAKLVKLQAARASLERVSVDNRALTQDERRRLDELARDFPKVWNHPKADPKLKKNLLRSAIHEIIVKHEPSRTRLEVTIHWKGGVHTRIHVAKRNQPKGNKADPALLELVARLSQELSDPEVARILNMKKIATPRGLRWTQVRVQHFRRHHRIPAPEPKKNSDQLTMSETCTYLDVSRNALLALVKKGAVSSNQITDFAPWRVSRQELDSDRVQSFIRILKRTGRLPRGGCPENQLTIFDDER